MPSPLPNDVSFGRLGPSHLDPLKSATLQAPDPHHVTLPFESQAVLHVTKEPIPLACSRPLTKLYRCKMINGEDKCGEEEAHFLSVCPNPVLAEMRNMKLQREKHKQIQLADYRKAMNVSDYNKGRSVSEVSLSANKFSGFRHNLRPDTIWADERYANVTPQEIEEAKTRLGEHQKRLDARLNPKVQEVPHVDPNQQYVRRTDLPVYVK